MTVKQFLFNNAKRVSAFYFVLCGLAFSTTAFACSGATPSDRESEQTSVQKDHGAMTPKAALEYMKSTSDLVIVDVATISHYNRKHFEGAINIPIENIGADEAKELYMKIPSNRPVILHCRLGMIAPGAYRRLKELRPDIPEIAYINGAPLFDEYNEWKKTQAANQTQNLLGGLTPQDALDYMKKHTDLVIVEVREPQWIGSKWFEGSIRIPWSEMEQRYNEIPAGSRVILNCGLGQMAPRAYKILTEKRKDIPEISYIAGAPLFDEYNEWKNKQSK